MPEQDQGKAAAVSQAAATTGKGQRHSQKEPPAVNLSRPKPVPQLPTLPPSPPPFLEVWTRPQNSNPPSGREALSSKVGQSAGAPNRKGILRPV